LINVVEFAREDSLTTYLEEWTYCFYLYCDCVLRAWDFIAIKYDAFSSLSSMIRWMNSACRLEILGRFCVLFYTVVVVRYRRASYRSLNATRQFFKTKDRIKYF